jgi:hypothetical protein
MRGTVIPLAVLVLVLPGCGSARQSPEAGDPAAVVRSINPADVMTRIVGGSPEQQNVLREVLAGIGVGDFTEVEIQKPEPVWGPSSADSVALVVPRRANDLREEWLSWIVGQAFAQRSHELGLPPVRYLASDPGGVDAEDLSGFGVSQDSVGITPAKARRAAEAARRAAELNGAEVERIEILRPYGYAFHIELRVKGDAARFLQYGLARVLESIGGPYPEGGSYVGDYTLVVDGNGERLWEGAEAALGDGLIQVGGAEDRDLRGCGPFFHSAGPDGRGAQPCPTDSGARSKPPPSDITTRIVGATPKQESVLREILAGLGETVIEEIRVAPAGKDWTPFKPNSVVVRLETAKTDEKERAGWEAALVAEAFEARSRALKLQPVAAYEAGDDGIALDGPDEPDPDDRAPVTREEIESGIVSGAKESDAEIVTLRIVEPRHLAAAVTLRVGDPASFLKHRLRRFLEAVPSSGDRQYDGLYVLVVDGRGNYVWVSAGTVGDTISGGAEGARPDLAGCYPNPFYGSATGKEPPPCPVE